MDAEVERLLRLGPVRVRDAIADGVPRGRFRSAARPFRGVVARADEDRLASIAARLDEHQFLSHQSAARLWGIRLPPAGSDDPLQVSTIGPHNPPRLRGVVGHRLDERRVELTMLQGIRVTTAAETWRHLSTVLPLDDLIVAGDSLLRRREPVATAAMLVRAIARHGGMRGVRRLRAAHALVRSGTDSAAETRLRLMLLRGGLPEPVVNPGVDLAGYGRAHLDLAYPDSLVAVEFDGVQHRVDARQFERDVRRHEALALSGWHVTRVLAVHLADPPDVVARVAAVLNARESSVVVVDLARRDRKR